MYWEPVFENKFLKLSFQKLITEHDENVDVYKAHAYFQLLNKNQFSGTWFDNKGKELKLQGGYSNKTFTIYWSKTQLSNGNAKYTFLSNEELLVEIFGKDSSDKITDKFVLDRFNQNKNQDETFVTGIGGIFIKSINAKATREWYNKNLGINSNEQGVTFSWRHENDSNQLGFTVWHLFDKNCKEFVINYRVLNLELLLKRLKKNGIEQMSNTEEYQYGKFAWIKDPEGNGVELWEPNDKEYQKIIGHP